MGETNHPQMLLVHGYRVQQHPLYATWGDMKARCNNPRCKGYENYGGRGIGYCERWKHFINFAEDMWPRPEGATLERKDNNGNYTPDNCTWATKSEQTHNRRVFKNNSAGITGVVPYRGGYNARHNHDGIRYDLGNFNTIEEAAVRRQEFIELFEANDPQFKDMLSKGNSDRRLKRTATTGIKGINRHKQGFTVRRYVNGVREYLGFSTTFEGAVALLEKAP